MVDNPNLTDYIKRTVDQAPPLTREQRDRLSLLLSIKKTVDEWPSPPPAQRDRLALLLRDETEPPLDPMGGSVLDEMLGDE